MSEVGALARRRRSWSVSNFGRRDSKPTLVEVGCAVGLFLDMARFAGWEVQGIEPNEEYAKWGRENLGLEIVSSLVEKERVGRKFDAVVALEVLEHSQDPVAFVSSLVRLLEKDGVMLLSTPNIASREFSSTDKTLVTSGAAHTFVLSKVAMRLLLLRCGLRSVSVCEASGPWDDERLIAIASPSKELELFDAFQNKDASSDSAALSLSRKYLLSKIEEVSESNLLRQPATFRLSELFLSTKDYQQAEQLSHSVMLELENDGLSLVEAKRIAEETERQGNYERFVEKVPGYFADLLNVRGIALLNLKRYTEAESAFELAYAILKTSANAPKKHIVWGDESLRAMTLFRVGLAKLDRGLAQEATAVFREALSEHHGMDERNLAEILFNLGVANLNAGLHREGLDSFRQILDLGPDNKSIRLFLRGLTQFIEDRETRADPNESSTSPN
jgi:tetratricopeptide (TPR) repeat protein